MSLGIWWLWAAIVVVIAGVALGVPRGEPFE